MPPSNVPPWVAIIDDDEWVRRSLVRLLRTLGVAARAFTSGEEYLAGVSEARPAGILLDIHLRAGMSGFELSARLRARHDSTPIVFITGADESDLALPTDSEHSSGLLRKPFDAEQLIELTALCFGLDVVPAAR
jgi:FixJ family two-component response regulator